MVRLCVNHWNGAFALPKVIARIRRKVQGNLRMGQSVLLDFEHVRGMDRSSFEALVADWPAEKVKLLVPGMQAWMPEPHRIPPPPAHFLEGEKK